MLLFLLCCCGTIQLRDKSNRDSVANAEGRTHFNKRNRLKYPLGSYFARSRSLTYAISRHEEACDLLSREPIYLNALRPWGTQQPMHRTSISASSSCKTHTNVIHQKARLTVQTAVVILEFLFLFLDHTTLDVCLNARKTLGCSSDTISKFIVLVCYPFGIQHYDRLESPLWRYAHSPYNHLRSALKGNKLPVS